MISKSSAVLSDGLHKKKKRKYRHFKSNQLNHSCHCSSFGDFCRFVLFPQDHPHVGVRPDLREEQQGVLQLLLALLPLLLAGRRGVLPLVLQEAVEEVLVLEALLLVHCRAHSTAQGEAEHGSCANTAARGRPAETS